MERLMDNTSMDQSSGSASERTTDQRLQDLELRLAAMQRQNEQILRLLERADTRQGKIGEAWEEFAPIAKDVMGVAIERLDGLEKAGWFGAARAGAYTLERVIGGFSEAELRAFGDAVVDILRTVQGLTRPEVLAVAHEAGALLAHPENVRPLGAVGLLRAGTDEEVQRGMALMLELLKHVGRVAHASTSPHVVEPRAPGKVPEGLPRPGMPPKVVSPTKPAAACATPEKTSAPAKEVVFEGIRFMEDGTLLEPEKWSMELASKLAPGVGVPELTEAHQQVLLAARTEHAATGATPNIRRLTQIVGIGPAQLYALFPQAPGRAVARVAGLPKPAGCL
jgi:tRNA 2-thiouridine synthesizing protein E